MKFSGEEELIKASKAKLLAKLKMNAFPSAVFHCDLSFLSNSRANGNDARVTERLLSIPTPLPLVSGCLLELPGY